jgi:hypothetical protein
MSLKIVPQFPFQILITGVTVSRAQTVGAGYFFLTIFILIQRNRQNCSSLFLHLYFLGQQTGRQKILHRMIARIL